MGFEGVGDNKMLGLRFTSRHKRSKSLPDKKRVEETNPEKQLSASDGIELGREHVEDHAKTKKNQSPTSEVQSSLKQEIFQLEKRLQNQFEVRCAIEKALGFKSSSHVNPDDSIMPKPATELIKEIAGIRVGSCVFGTASSFLVPYSAAPSGCQEVDTPWKESNVSGAEEKSLDSSVHRCQSSLSQHSAFTTRTSRPVDSLAKALRACHSQPLSMMEYAQNASSNIISLAEHLGTCISDHVPETPNRLSEEMVKCMSTIYYKLADPPLTHAGLSSPSSSMSSISGFSPPDQHDMWSSQFGNNSSFDVRLDNPFHVEGLKEFSGPYSTMVEVPWIYKDSLKLGDIEGLLQNFRSLISRLEEVDLRKLKHEEKIAFWINIHNSLVMHAFLAYGIPQNNVKRVFLLLKSPAYNVGGQTVSADTIQSTILGCRMSRPGQWLRVLLSSKTKFKTGDERRAFTIEQSEPLLHFALCSGNHSDPAVRVYTPKRLFQELEVAKEEYIRASFGVRKDKKILLPKIVESFAKDSGLCPAGLMEMIQQSLPESLRKSIKKYQLSKPRKSIEWIPHNFTFRYLISKELVK
ncbi:Ternary complex factor MIP1, leucine-zipper [Quillaja saponaria]|uniref:Ternary complex factor MIP1, leucine-zipper n=1 Tax=Quillaja saponaria TaxID=32244 RepID=A0AAD7PFG0_QUISA|nr:Ternary complex factor MIP1, leucine-zipper [Quillaja saponaria]